MEESTPVGSVFGILFAYQDDGDVPKIGFTRLVAVQQSVEGAGRSNSGGRGERPVACGRDAQLRALKEGRAWPNADFGGTGTDSGCAGMRPDASQMRRDASRMRRDASGF